MNTKLKDRLFRLFHPGGWNVDMSDFNQGWSDLLESWIDQGIPVTQVKEHTLVMNGVELWTGSTGMWRYGSLHADRDGKYVKHQVSPSVRVRYVQLQPGGHRLSEDSAI